MAHPLFCVSGFLTMLWVALDSKRVEATHSIVLMPPVGESCAHGPGYCCSGGAPRLRAGSGKRKAASKASDAPDDGVANL